MDKYEYNVRVEQISKLVAEKDYKTAAKISDSIDWRRVRSVSTLMMVGEVYENCRRYEDARDILLMAYEKAPIGRRTAYRLTEVCIKASDFVGAKKYYEDFVNLSPNDNRKYELLYEINRKQGVPAAKRLAILEEYAKSDIDEYWGLELAICYYEAGMNDECVKQCDKLFLWFGEGEHVVHALELKEMITPLTEKQAEVVKAFYETPKEPVKEVVPREKQKTINKLKRRAAKKHKSSVKSIEEQLEERENNSSHAEEATAPDATRDIRKEQEEIQAILSEQKTALEGGVVIHEQANDQIEGQMTLEDVLLAYEDESVTNAEEPEAVEIAEAVEAAAVVETVEAMRTVEVTETADAMEQIAEIDYNAEAVGDYAEEETEAEAVGLNTDTLESDAALLDYSTVDISEAVARVADEMLEIDGDEIYTDNALTEEQQKTFKQFLYMRGMEEQLVNIFQSVAEHRADLFRSAEGNIIIVGDYKSGKTTLGINVIKEINTIRRRYNRRIAKINGERLNSKGIRETLSQLSDSDLLIERVGRMSKATLQGLLQFMSGSTGGMLVVFEDTREAMEYILSQVPEARTYFNYYIELREVEIADWVNVAENYCKENDFRIDDVAKLALSAKISQISKDDFTIEFEDVKKIADEAIRRYKRRRFFKRKDDDNGISVLKEIDFK